MNFYYSILLFHFTILFYYILALYTIIYFIEFELFYKKY